MFEAATNRMVAEHNARAWLAWNIAALSRMPKRMPDLSKLLLKRHNKKRGRQSLEQQRAIVRMLANTYSQDPPEKS